MLRWDIVLVLILILFVHPIVINQPLLIAAVDTIILTIIFYWLIRDYRYAIVIALTIVIVIYYHRRMPSIEEGFDGGDILKELEDLVSQTNTPSTKNNNNDNDNDDDNDNKKDIKESDVNVDDIGLDDDEDKPLKKGELPKLDGDYMSKMTSAKAQRETFRLIDTIQQLDDTIKNLAPTLEKGAGLIERFKKLNLVKM